MFVIKKEDGTFYKTMFESRELAKTFITQGYVTGTIMRVQPMFFTSATLKYLEETGCIEIVF